jgi:hypothetical protein
MHVDNQPAIYIGDDIYVVSSIIGSVERESDLLNSVLIPPRHRGRALVRVRCHQSHHRDGAWRRSSR